MAGKTKMQRASELMTPYIGRNLGLEGLKNLIRINLTSKEKEITEYLHLMDAVGIIKENEAFRFKIGKMRTNAEIIDEL